MYSSVQRIKTIAQARRLKEQSDAGVIAAVTKFIAPQQDYYHLLDHTPVAAKVRAGAMVPAEEVTLFDIPLVMEL